MLGTCGYAHSDTFLINTMHVFDIINHATARNTSARDMASAQLATDSVRDIPRMQRSILNARLVDQHRTLLRVPEG